MALRPIMLCALLDWMCSLEQYILKLPNALELTSFLMTRWVPWTNQVSLSNVTTGGDVSLYAGVPFWIASFYSPILVTV
ncbi:hypothetical protein BGZ63DRAFT_81498 [Mariannaea sp. PMI_226]|nr:hypothetical protein BGZ63DRAFT_81498 [Mariannaea sp. PMI_226]